MLTRVATPENVISTKIPSRNRTLFAFFTEGSLKLGTALLTASTPVNAEQPLEKARKIKNIETVPVAFIDGVSGT